MILSRVATYPNERLDIPDFRALEAFGQNDWIYFQKGILTAKSQVISGFEISNYSNIFFAAGINISLNDVAMLHPEATTQAAGFYVSAGSEPDAVLTLSPSSTNYVEVDFSVSTGTTDDRAFWDMGANGGAGGEYTAQVDTVINLELTVTSNISGFTTGRLPLYKIVTNSSGIETSVTDCRPMFFRLGAGGSSPDPTNNYAWSSTPDSTHARLETPVTATSATTSNAPFQGGDKNIKSFKNWMDAVMSMIKEIKGTPYWYSPTFAGAGAVSLYQNAALTILEGGQWTQNPPFLTTTGNLTAGSNQLTSLASTTGIVGGNIQTITEVDVPDSPLATVSSIVGSTVTMSANALSTVTGASVAFARLAAGQLQMTGTSNVYRLGMTNKLTLSTFLIDLAIKSSLYILLPVTDTAVTYGYGQDAATPVVPEAVSAVTSTSITVATGGNYITGGGNLLVHGQVFAYTAYNAGTGVFSGVTPDPSGLVNIGDNVYQAESGGTGFYHYSARSAVPGVTSGVSMGADRVFWLAHFENTGTSIALRFGNIIPGQTISASSSTISDIISYIGSPGAGAAFPEYITTATGALASQTNYNSVDGEDLTDRISRLTSMIADKAQDKGVKVLANYAKVVNTTSGANQLLTFTGGTQSASVTVPGSTNLGTITLTGTLTLAANQAAYFTIDRANPFSVANLGALTVANISSVPISENTFVFAYRLSDTNVYLWNTTPVAAGAQPSPAVAYDPTSGHAHTGAAGDGPNIASSSISGVVLSGALVQGTNFSSSAASSDNVTSLMGVLPHSTGDTVEGVVVIAPNNLVKILNSANQTQFLDATGNKIYGRITWAASVWTLSYFSDINGTETAYTWAAPATISWWFEQLFNPITDKQVHETSRASSPANPTSDIMDAAASQRGAVNTSAQTFGGAKTFAGGIIDQTTLALNRQDVASAGSPFNPLSVTKSFVKLTGTTAAIVKGISAGTDGQIVEIYNGTNQTATINASDAGAAAAQQIILPSNSNRTILASGSMTLQYDANQSKWVLIAEGGLAVGALSSTPPNPVNATASAGATGIGSDSGHVHAYTFATTVGQPPTQQGSAGTSLLPLAADHTHAFSTGFDNGSVSNGLTIDWNNGQSQRVQLTGYTTIDFINPVLRTYYILRIRMDSTGNWPFNFPLYVRFVNGTLPGTVGANKSVIIRMHWDGINYLAETLSVFDETVINPAIGGSAAIDPYTGFGWVWGTASGGRLGNNTVTQLTVPSSIPHRVFSKITDIDSGPNAGYGIDNYTGMVWAWGPGTQGQLGNNNTVNTSSPVTIARTASYSAVAAAYGDTTLSSGFAIDAATGMIWGWGANSTGSLGNNTATANFSSPVTISRSASYSFVTAAINTSAVVANGFAIDAATKMIWAWGNNAIIGNNTATATSSPVTIARSSSYSAVAIESGNTCAFAIDSTNGMIWGWGVNSGGQLGNNTATGTSSPVTIARSSSYSAIACCTLAAAAIDGANGMIWTWGSNGVGQLGNNTTTSTSSPVTIARSASYMALTASGGQFFALDSTGVIWAWGNNGTTASLGAGHSNAESSPVTVARVTSYAKAGAAGGYTSSGGNAFAIDAATGMIWGWGTNSGGQLGNNTITSAMSPVTISRSASYTAVAVVTNSTADTNITAYAIDGATGMVWSWGAGASGALGNNTTTAVSSPVTIARSASYSQVVVGGGSGVTATAFVIDAATGMIWGWGAASSGQLGNNTTTVVSSPVTIARSASYSAIAAGGLTPFAIDAATGMIWAWGSGANGALGNNTATNVSSPVTIARSASYSSVATTGSTGLAIDAATGMIWSWGTGTSGQLGNNTTTTVSSPVTIARSSSYSKVAGGTNNAFAIDAATGMIWAWGSNSNGQLGNNTAIGTSSPVTIARSASYSNVFAVTNGSVLTTTIYAVDGATGVIYAWGSNINPGILGINFNGDFATSPVSVARLFASPSAS